MKKFLESIVANEILRPILAYWRPILDYRHCLRLTWGCVRPCVIEIVRAIPHRPYILGSPSLDQRYKRPWLFQKSLYFQTPSHRYNGLNAKAERDYTTGLFFYHEPVTQSIWVNCKNRNNQDSLENANCNEKIVSFQDRYVMSDTNHYKQI